MTVVTTTRGVDPAGLGKRVAVCFDPHPPLKPRAGSGVVRIDPLLRGRMSYKATEPGSVCHVSMFFYSVVVY